MLDKIKKYNPITVLVHHIQLERRVKGLYKEYGKDKTLESEIEGSSDGKTFNDLAFLVSGFALCMAFSELVLSLSGLGGSSTYNFVLYPSMTLCFVGIHFLMLYENKKHESRIKLYECNYHRLNI